MNTVLNVFGKKLAIGIALSASMLMTVSPAQARDRYYDRGGNDAAIAIGAGVIGLALGAAIADRGDRNYYDRDYYDMRRYVTIRDRPGYYYYYDGYPNRYYNDRYYNQYYAPYYRDRYSRGGWGHGNSWDRGNAWGRNDRWDRGQRRDYRGNYRGYRGFNEGRRNGPGGRNR